MSLRFLLPLLAYSMLSSWQLSLSPQSSLILANQREAAPTKGYISGKVLTTENEPFPDIPVVLESKDSARRYRTLTSSEGSYVFPDIPTGEYLIRFRLRDGREITGEVRHVPTWTRVFGAVGPDWEYSWPNSTINVKVEPEQAKATASVPTATLAPTRSSTPLPTPVSTPLPTPAATATPRPRHSRTPSSTPAPPSPPPANDGGPDHQPTATPKLSPSPEPSSTPMAKIDELLAKMNFGNIAFNVPPSMSLQKAEAVTLLLSLKQTSDQLADQLKKDGMTGDIKDAHIRVHDNMQAVISGDGFQITALTPETLPVSKQEPTQWKWDVRAQRTGTLSLHVTLNAIVDVDDGSGPKPYPIRTFTQTYIVNVSWRDGAVASFIQQNFTWLWATLVVPVGGWIWNQKRKRRRRQNRS